MPARPASHWRFGAALGWTITALTAAFGVRTAYFFWALTAGRADVGSRHLEAAATAFVVLAIITAYSRRADTNRPAPGPLPAFPIWLWPAFVIAALALYWPVLSAGLLSDDFVLLARTDRWQIGEVTPALFRPLPLAIWAGLRGLGAGAAILHAANVVVHGTVAYLTVRLAAGWLPNERAAVMAGAIVLSMPLLVEPVAWISGTFDLTATVFVLAAVLAARRYDAAYPRSRWWMFAAALAAMASKEAAVVTPAILAIDALARRRGSRPLWRDIGVLFVAAAVFSAVRLYSAFGAASPPVDKYTLQRALFETFGAFAVPWHSDVIHGLPWLAVAGVSGLVAGVAAFAVFGHAERRRVAIAAGAWIIVSVVPVFPIVFIANDLQGARYLYLAAPAWATLLVIFIWVRSATRSPIAITLAFIIVAIGAAGVRWHLRPWTEAAVVRDRVVSAAVANQAMAACGVVTLEGLPDHVRGAYVFRNGAAEALAAAAGIRVVGDAPDPCRFRWNADRSTFTPAR